MACQVTMTVSDAVRIGWHTTEELISAINRLRAAKITRIEPCLPECTDTRKWSLVCYERNGRI